jgi:hypothetical protein
MLSSDSSRFVLLVVCWCGGALPGDARPTHGQPSDAPITCAVIADCSEAATALAGLIEQQLGKEAGTKLVERAAIQSILDEQTFSAAFASEGVASRVALGNLLKADVLVLIRERKASADASVVSTGRKPASAPANQGREAAIELVVAETAQGIRLAMVGMIWDAEHIEEITSHLCDVVSKARGLYGRKDLRIFAVPVFESKDVSARFDYRRSGLARLVESSLMQLPNVVVVELAEARNLGREVAIAGNRVERVLPQYLMGSYETTGRDDPRTSVSIELRQGDTVLGSIQRKDVPEEQLGMTVRAMVAELLPRACIAASSPAVAPAGPTEASILANRGDVSLYIGEWEEAMSLYESALLLEPTSERAHVGMFVGYSQKMVTGTFRPVQTRYCYDATARVHAIGGAVDHLKVLLPMGAYRNKLFVYWLDRFCLCCHLQGYDLAGDPEHIAPLFNETQRQLAGTLTSFLMTSDASPRRRDSEFVALSRLALRKWMEVAFANAAAGAAGCEQFSRLFDTHPDQQQNLCVLVASAGLPYVGAPTEELQTSYRVLAETLTKAKSGLARLAGEAGLILNTVRDRPSYEAALAQLDRLGSVPGKDPQTIVMFKWMAGERLAKIEQEPPSTEPEPHVMVPRLVPLQVELDSGEDVSQYHFQGIYSWPEVEVMDTSRGFYRIECDGLLTYLSPERTHYPPTWDGERLWMVTSDGVLVLNRDGHEVVRFQQDEVVRGEKVLSGRLVCVRPGKVCFFGVSRTDQSTLRNWAVLLTLEFVDNKPVSCVEPLLELRTESRTGAVVAGEASTLGAFLPQWLLGGQDRSGASFAVVGGAGLPLLLDLDHKAAFSSPYRWPSYARPVEYNGRAYLASGNVGGLRQRSAVYVNDISDEPPRLLVDFGESPSSYKGGIAEPYFRSVVLWNDILYLLSDTDPARVPEWCAVDLRTLKAYMLADVLPREYPPSLFDCLCASRAYGLVFYRNRKLYRVELPPIEQWPVLESVSYPENLKPPTTVPVK